MKIELKILEYAEAFYKKTAEEMNFNRFDKYKNLPQYETAGAGGMDLRIIEDVTLSPGECRLVGTGIAVHLGTKPPNSGSNLLDVAAMILPRSGKGHQGLILGNSVGLLDEDYQGEIKIILWNRLTCAIPLFAGDKVAQLVIFPVIKAQWELVQEFTITTARGEGGFGSTGLG
jgi:dUTP pyrophosphatase